MNKKIIIGNLIPDNNIFLAPMAGVTDKSFRIICKEFGAGLVYTEMASAKGISYNSKKSFEITAADECEHPVGVQLFGSDPKIMSDTARRLADEGRIDLFDINMGCPAPKITKNGEGSALMLNPVLAGQIISAVAEAIRPYNIPLTVKLRKGWDDEHICAVQLAKIAEDSGAAAVCIHGRTRMQYYSGKADYSIIADVKRALSIPVIGNGDIFKPSDAIRMQAETGCDGVMCARGAQGNPWLFRGILDIYSGSDPDLTDRTYRPEFPEIVALIKRHLELMTEHKGEYMGVLEMRKHIAWYLKGFSGAAVLRNNIYKAEDRKTIISILESATE